MAVASREKESSRHYAFAAFVKDSASEALLQQVFRSDSLNETYLASGGVDAAVAWLKKHGRSPQRLLVDISGSSRPLDELDRLADACEPSVQVYVVGDRNDVGLFRNLLTRGVQDYIVKPLNTELVRRTLSETAAVTRRGRYGSCVAVLGTRGGVGVTAVATQLARGLVRGGTRRRVVYVDLNVYDGAGPSALGRPGGSALLDVLGNIDRLDQQYLERTLADAGDGLFVLAAELEYSDEFHPEAATLGKLLDTLCQYFHYVVLDLPQRGGDLAAEALSHTSIACLVAEPSVHSARTLTRLVRHIESRTAAPTVLTVLNHPQPVTRHRVRLKDFAEATDVALQVQIGYDPKGPVLAENLGQDLKGGGEFARGIRDLSARVTGESDNKPRGGWWHRTAGARA